MGRLPGSRNTSASRPQPCPGGSVGEEAGRVVRRCPTTSLAKDTMVMLARAHVTVRAPPVPQELSITVRKHRGSIGRSTNMVMGVGDLRVAFF